MEKYERVEMEVVEFETEDVIMVSGTGDLCPLYEYDEDELPLVPAG